MRIVLILIFRNRILEVKLKIFLVFGEVKIKIVKLFFYFIKVVVVCVVKAFLIKIFF